MDGIEQGWPQHGSCTSLARVTQVACSKNIHVVYMHMRLTANGVSKDFPKDNHK